MVGDKFCFSRNRWISYGLCFLAGWMWNQRWGTYEEHQILMMILNECEDKGGYEGIGSIQEISSLMKIFKDRWWRLS